MTDSPIATNSDLPTLGDLNPGERATVQRVTARNSRLAERLLAMGLVAGTVIEVICKAPFGDPIQIKARGYDLSLRQSEAEQILVSKLVSAHGT